MIANSAFLAAMLLMLSMFVLMGELQVMAPYKHYIFPRHLWLVFGGALVVFINLFAACYLLARGLFLKDTGRKLTHVDRQLRSSDSIARDLSDRLDDDED